MKDYNIHTTVVSIHINFVDLCAGLVKFHMEGALRYEHQHMLLFMLTQV